MIESDFDALPGGDGWGRRQLGELEEASNDPYDWIYRTVVAGLIVLLTGVIAFGLFHFYPQLFH